MGANPHANGGILLRDLAMPDFQAYGVDVSRARGAVSAQDTWILGRFLRDVAKLNPHNFRIFGPDETQSNLLGAIFEKTNRQWGHLYGKYGRVYGAIGASFGFYAEMNISVRDGWKDIYLRAGMVFLIVMKRLSELLIRCLASMRSG